MNEAETCRQYVVPRLTAAGWDAVPHSYSEQDSFTDGRIVVTGSTARRQPKKRTDYLLRYTRDFPIAVVEAKATYKTPGTGLQQAKDYAELLDLKFAYATNGQGIIEFDYLTGEEHERDTLPTPDELWARLRQNQRLPDAATARLLMPVNHVTGKIPRYYQEIAINRAVQAIVQGQRRVLLTMATGTGKTVVAFQICWKLWSARWTKEEGDGGESEKRTAQAPLPAPHSQFAILTSQFSRRPRRPKILYLAHRNILIDDPKDKTFAAFGDARWKIEGGQVNYGRELYFATYQSLAQDERRPGLYREYDPGFFDLIVIDECHRGSASDESNWRQILEYFAPAYQLGMTATPKRADNEATYRYFGDPIYQYSLRQGIADGFLAPYRVHRVITTYDATGWRPTQGQLDRYGQPIPDEEYHTKDFERIVALRSRTEAIARHLTEYLKSTDRFAKTIVFCVDQQHADEMRRALTNLNSDLAKRYPDYVARVTSDEGQIGRGHLSNFQELETPMPTILTTSQLLTTGVDAPTCKNVVLARVIGSMTEFKQIIGRGTRVRDDYGKLSFTILDYTGSATQLFADPAFDGDPVAVTVVIVDGEGQTITTTPSDGVPPGAEGEREHGDAGELVREGRVKYFVDSGQVGIAMHLVYELDADGAHLRTVRLTDYTAEQVRTLYPSAASLRADWARPAERVNIVTALNERGIDFATLARAISQPESDPFDLLCHLAFDAPLRTRRERAERLRRDRRDFFDRYGPEARTVLNDLLDKYAAYGTAQFLIPDALKLPPLSERGNPVEIARLFGGAAGLRAAVEELQALLYAA